MFFLVGISFTTADDDDLTTNEALQTFSSQALVSYVNPKQDFPLHVLSLFRTPLPQVFEHEDHDDHAAHVDKVEKNRSAKM